METDKLFLIVPTCIFGVNSIISYVFDCELITLQLLSSIMLSLFAYKEPSDCLKHITLTLCDMTLLQYFLYVASYVYGYVFYFGFPVTFLFICLFSTLWIDYGTTNVQINFPYTSILKQIWDLCLPFLTFVYTNFMNHRKFLSNNKYTIERTNKMMNYGKKVAFEQGTKYMFNQQRTTTNSMSTLLQTLQSRNHYVSSVVENDVLDDILDDSLDELNSQKND
jgi:hypothetical protein